MFELFHVHGQSLPAFVEQLRSEGFDARATESPRVGVLIGPKGMDEKRMPIEENSFPLPPKRVEALFFPVSELNRADINMLVAARKFHDMYDAMTQAQSDS